jgi:hypothetical protein
MFTTPIDGNRSIEPNYYVHLSAAGTRHRTVIPASSVDKSDNQIIVRRLDGVRRILQPGQVAKITETESDDREVIA